MKDKILIMSGSEEDNALLHDILSDDYETSAAGISLSAFQLSGKLPDDIALVIINVAESGEGSYDFIKSVVAAYPDIPIVAVLSKDESVIEYLHLGVSDIIFAPVSPEVLLSHMSVLLKMRDSGKPLHTSDTDVLGRYNFLHEANRIIQSSPDKSFDMICSDVEGLKMINELHGDDVGDCALRFIYSVFADFASGRGICGKIGEDAFAFLTRRLEGGELDAFIDSVINAINDKEKSPVPNLVVKFGIYRITDRALSISAMCDRALIAQDSIKHKYGESYAMYDESMRINLIREQQILDYMEKAVSAHQFSVYLQPKHNLKTGEVSGAEALTRWVHPTLGFIPPCEFVPIFEENGFITALDYYVWEEVCRTMQKWKCEGREPLPISVNVSRIDFNVPDLADHISGLCVRYGIEPQLLHLEITETAYTDNSEVIGEVSAELRRRGFIIEMDDFGSGYSTLTMLETLPIDVLKLDVRFLNHPGGNSSDSKSILGFVLNLSKWLDLPTVAEGVETGEEFDMLTTMGCNYAQGYHCAKPMPIEEFEKYLSVNKIATGALNGNGYSESNNNSEDASTVLVIESDSEGRSELREMLSTNFRVVTTASCDEAIEWLKANSDDTAAMLLDLTDAEKECCNLIGMAKNVSELSGIPIIAVTGGIDSNSDLAAVRAGADYFIHKPYHRDIVLHYLTKSADTVRQLRQKSRLELENMILSKGAYHDELTGLFNRRGLSKAIERIGNEESYATMMIDIDNLKTCNDTFGHHSGDKLITTVAQTMKESTRNTDIIARLGGDEFVVILRRINDSAHAYDKGKSLCDAILHADIPNSACPPSCSAGMVIVHGRGAFDAGLKKADTALYHAKRALKGGCVLWDDIADTLNDNE